MIFGSPLVSFFLIVKKIRIEDVEMGEFGLEYETMLMYGGRILCDWGFGVWG